MQSDNKDTNPDNNSKQNNFSLKEIYNKYFVDLQNIEEINLLSPQIFQMFATSKEIIIKVENSIGISIQAFHVLYPLCSLIINNRQQENDEQLQIASMIILMMNGEHNTAWNIRQALMAQHKDESEYLQREMKLTELVSIKFPNSSIAYRYRLTCLIYLKATSFANLMKDEDNFFEKSLIRKNRNYNLWTYRMNLIKFLYLQKQDPDVLHREINFGKNMAGTQIHNYSMFHHMLILLSYNNSVEISQELSQWGQELEYKFKELYAEQLNESVCQEHAIKLTSIKQFQKMITKVDCKHINQV